MNYAIELDPAKIVLSKKTGDWCLIPYHGHPKGCPNYGRVGCPPIGADPKKTFRERIITPVYMVYSEFDLKAHMKRMQKKHPDWSERQLRCVLYWQNTSRKQLRERVAHVILTSGFEKHYTITLYCPEAYGMNVYATAQKHGFKLERIRHLETCHHIAIVGGVGALVEGVKK